MSADDLDATLRRMREDWDRRARENARHFVATGRTDWSDAEFFASGEAEVDEQIRNDMENICQGRDPATLRVLEIGCGTGRVTRALARLFGEVHAVDVSGEMVSRAREALTDCSNAHVYQNNGMDLSAVPELPFDFAFSIIVFQHIPSREVIESYFRDVARLLRQGGLFKVQLLGRPPVAQTPDVPREGIAGRLRRLIAGGQSEQPADPFDPPDTWVGAMYTPQQAEELAARTGLELRYQSGAGEEMYWLWCFKK